MPTPPPPLFPNPGGVRVELKDEVGTDVTVAPPLRKEAVAETEGVREDNTLRASSLRPPPPPAEALEAALALRSPVRVSVGFEAEEVLDCVFVSTGVKEDVAAEEAVLLRVREAGSFRVPSKTSVEVMPSVLGPGSPTGKASVALKESVELLNSSLAVQKPLLLVGSTRNADSSEFQCPDPSRKSRVIVARPTLLSPESAGTDKTNESASLLSLGTTLRIVRGAILPVPCQTLIPPIGYDATLALRQAPLINEYPSPQGARAVRRNK